MSALRRPNKASTSVGLDVGLLRQPDQLRARLQDAVGWPHDATVKAVSIKRLWPGRQGRITFEIAISLSHHGTTENQLIQGGLGKFDKPARSHIRASMTEEMLTGLRFEIQEPQAWFCTPDRDPKLRAVRCLWPTPGEPAPTSSTVEGFLTKHFGHATTAENLTTELLGYRARKRCVIRVRSKSAETKPGLIVKIFRRPPSDVNLNWLNTLRQRLSSASDGTLGTPRILATLAEAKTVCFVEVPRPAVRLGTSKADVVAAAKVLTTVHASGLAPPDLRHTPQDELETVNRWTEILPVLKPGYENRLCGIRDDLFGFSQKLDGSGTTSIHRDFYSAQVLRGADRVWLLDLDTICLGHRELDVATYTAHLLLDELLGGRTTSDALATASHFMNSYVEQGGLCDQNRLRFYHACAMTRLGAVHLTRGVSANIVDALWQQARSVLDSPQHELLAAAGHGQRVRPSSPDPQTGNEEH